MLLYCENKSVRLKYALTEFCRRAGIKEWELTDSEEEFRSSGKKPKINYSEKEFPGTLRVVPAGFLNESSYRNFVPDILENKIWKKIIFPSSGDIPFDLFSAMFFFLSRYEEHGKFKPDIHNRFTAENSLALRFGFLEVPLIEYWVSEIKKIMQEKSGTFRDEREGFKFICSLDIDNAYAFKGKGLVHNAAASVKNFLNGNNPELLSRISVLRNRKKDPYDTYSWITGVLEQFNIESLWFFLLGDRSAYDRNISWRNSSLRELIRDISAEYNTGIHPSYNSFLNNKKIQEEVERLSHITGKKTVMSRQHFLRFCLPDTYRSLADAGILHEYSMGYADQQGFRASTCFPFYFYDLEKEEISGLLVHPLVLMDGTLNEYRKLSIDEARLVSEDIIGKIKTMKGECIVLWHNDTLNDKGKWKGWREVFLHQLNCARN